MKRIFVYLAFLGMAAALPLGAQQPKKVTEKFFPDPDIKMDIPIFKKKTGFTSHKEMVDFINGLVAKYPSLFSVETVGKSQKDRDIVLVTAKKQDGDNDKLRILYYARVHGDEPSGTEAMLYFMTRIAENPEVNALLDKVDFYIMPMVNPDGAESFTRATANGIDPNRDQSKLDTPEAITLHAVANRVQPQVAVDFHEYQPIRSDFSRITSDIISTPWDVMFLYSGNPNVPEILRIEMVENLFVKNLERAMDDNGLTHHTYYVSRDDFGKIRMNVGGASPRSTSNAMALKNCISMLMETRGIKLDRVSIKRRIYTVYTGALSVAETAAANVQLIKEAISQAEADRGDVAVKFSSARETMKFPFIDVIRNKLVEYELDARLANRPTVTLSRPLPEAYYLLPSEKKAAQKLRQMGVEVTELEQETPVDVEGFVVTSLKEEADQVGGVYPVTVETRVVEKNITLPAGTYKVDTHQKNVRAASVMLEPESSNGFVNYRVVGSELGKELPLYREKQ